MAVLGGRHGAPARLLALSVAVFALAACGAPEYTYVTNSDDRTYLRIPHEWQPVDAKSLADAFGVDPSVEESDRGIWVEAYDADASPSASHVLGADSPAPAVLISVLDVPMSARGQISLDGMRDLFHPVSAAARQQDAANPASGVSGFGLINDEVLTPGAGLRGVHSVYRYSIQGGPSQVFDQIIYANDDASKIYIFYARCSTECYQQRQQEIENVASSFTVREKT